MLSEQTYFVCMQTQSVWDHKTGAYWRLLRFAMEQIHVVEKNHDWIEPKNHDWITKKDGKYVPSYNADLPSDRRDYLDFTSYYDKTFKKVSDNIAMASAEASAAGELVGNRITASDQKRIRQYDRLLAKNPDDSDSILYEKADLLEKLGKYEDAINCYDEIGSDVRDGGRPALFRKAYLLHHIGRHKESLKCFSYKRDTMYIPTILIDAPLPDHRLHLKGVFLANVGKYEDSIRYYDMALGKKLDRAEEVTVLTAKGDVLVHLGSSEEAIRCYDKALEINQNGGPLYYCYGSTYDVADALSRKISIFYHLGRYNEAVECYDAIINETGTYECYPVRPPRFSMTVEFAKVLFLDEIGRHDEAVKCHRELVSKYRL